MLTQFAATELHVSLAAEELWRVGPISITNSVVFGVIGLFATAALLFYVAHKLRHGKRNFLVSMTQWAFEGFLNQTEEIVGNKQVARGIFPLAITIFFVALINYWLSVLPGVGSITYNGVPVFRSLVADLNFTTGLAIVSAVASQLYAVKYHGIFGNIGRYVKNPFKDPVGAFEGLLEFIGEFSRYISLSFRLFGNAFAGEVLLLLIAVLSGYFTVVSLPFFIAFELFIGFIQAYVFFVLTVIFTSLAVQTHGPDSSDHSPAAVPTEAAK